MNHWMRFTKNEQRGLLVWSLCLMVITIGHTLFLEYLQAQQRLEALEILKRHSAQEIAYASDTNAIKQITNKAMDKTNGKHQIKAFLPSAENDIYRKTDSPGEKKRIDQKNVNQRDSIPNQNRSIQIAQKTGKSGPLNINTATPSDFMAIGFPDYIAERVCTFREKVRMFESIADLKEIYGIDTFMVNALSDQLHVNLDDLPKIEMNTATAAEWESLKGIGKTYAKRILQYRDRLGGFYSAAQLLEVYGVDSALYESISFRLKVEKNRIETININSSSLQELASHPYISWREADLIKNYRKQHGQLNDIKDCKGLSNKWCSKMESYIAYE